MSQCRMCGREIMNQLSRERGYGPICYEKHLEEVKKLQLELNFNSRFRPDMSANDKHKVINELLGLK